MSLRVVSALSKDHQIPGEDWERLLWHNGKLFSSSYSNGDVKIWSSTLQPLGSLHAHDHPIYDMATEGGSRFFTCSTDCTINHWEEAGDGSFSLLGTLSGHQEPPRRLIFDPERKLLFSGDELGQVLIWEDDKLVGSLETMEEIWEMCLGDEILLTTRISDVVVNNVSQKGDKFRHSIRNTLAGRGPLLISDDNRLCFMDRDNFQVHINEAYKTGNPNLAKLQGHTAIVNAMAERNGILYTGGGDKQLIAWDLKSLTKIDTLSLDGYVNSITISEDNMIFVGGQDKSIVAVQLT